MPGDGHCGSQPDYPLTSDTVRFICTRCVSAAMHSNAKPLTFPRAHQEEFLITATIPCTAATL